MEGPLIFITGSTGFIGAHVVRVALESGYAVRLSIRKPEQEATVRARYPQHASRISFALIPDFSTAEAFDEALKDVEYVLHLASPMPGAGPDVRKDFVGPAVQATVSVLRAALGISSVKKVVVMSSVVALVPADALLRHNEDISVTDNTGEVIHVDLDGPFPDGVFGQAVKYASSKILAHQATRDFMMDNKPKYKLLTFHPTYVLGDDVTQDTAEGLGGVNGMLMMSLASDKPIIGTAWVHVRDVADALVRAVESDIESGTEFLLTSAAFGWEEAVAYVKGKYPDVDIKLEPPFGDRWSVDTRTTEKALGMTWRSKEQILDDVVGQQVALRARGA